MRHDTNPYNFAAHHWAVTQIVHATQAHWQLSDFVETDLGKGLAAHLGKSTADLTVSDLDQFKRALIDLGTDLLKRANR